MIEIKKGLDLPISGVPRMQIETGRAVRHLALIGDDYIDMKPTLLVAEGDTVRLGQPLFSDKKNPTVLYTAPGTGKVIAINRGERRHFQSLVIELSDETEESFATFNAEQLVQIPAAEIEQQLLTSGLWIAFRTRPYSKVPAPGTRPTAIFVSAIDTNPLAADPQFVIAEQSDNFSAGMRVIRNLTEGNLYLCQQPGAKLPPTSGIAVREFSGCHPAGLVGTHIHCLEKVDQQHCVWHLGYQDVIAIGHLFLTGRILVDRIIALAGSGVKNPRLLRTRLGACLSELLNGELQESDNRVISGSVLSGRTAGGSFDYLGRYHNQISVLPEDQQRQLFGWALPGFDKFSLKRVFASAFFPTKAKRITTSTHGSPRAMVPIGAFEKVLPQNTKATWLLRALLTRDTDLAQQLGCLELDEEDLALCSFVCNGKIDYGYHLRQTLRKIEKEG